MAKKKGVRTGKQQKTAELKTTRTLGLEVVHPQAAGIDVGNGTHYVAVPPHLDESPVRTFGCFTSDLKALADWLVQLNVTTVALQSTGVYWIPLYDMLRDRGIRVFIVNARDTKNVPGRKSDVQECQWLLKLHVYGLLRNSFRPDDEILMLRALWRHRQEHIGEAARCIQRMQKALTQMNVQLANVISDITGVSGQAILKAILDGERDPQKLAALCDPAIRASRETVAKSLEGNWRQEHLFVLRQEFATYQHFQGMIEGCETALHNQLRTMEEKADAGDLPPCPRNKRPRGNPVEVFDLRKELFRVTGVDLTKVDGINAVTAQTIISEIGLDVSAWPTEQHFVSWLNLAPRNKISGGRVIGKDKRKVINRAGQALRMAANGLRQSDSYLGAQYRRLRSKLDTPCANKAMANKLARLIYRVMKFGQEYVDKGAQSYEEAFRRRQILAVAKRAAGLGFQLSPAV